MANPEHLLLGPTLVDVGSGPELSPLS